MPRGTFVGVALVAVLTLLVLGSPLPGTARAAGSSASAVEYYRLDPGTPTKESTTYALPIFVVAEPVGSVANRSVTQQAWQELQVVEVGTPTVPFLNWSVPEWSTGEFELVLSLTAGEVRAIEGGQAILALNSSIRVGSTVVGAAGIIDGAVLDSAVVVGSWWSAVFGIPTPPPDPTPSSLPGILDDLAWFGASTAGRATYAATTIVAVLLYLWEGHKLARAKLSGDPPRSRREAA
jgi:hypothetical protein